MFFEDARRHAVSGTHRNVPAGKQVNPGDAQQIVGVDAFGCAFHCPPRWYGLWAGQLLGGATELYVIFIYK